MFPADCGWFSCFARKLEKKLAYSNNTVCPNAFIMGARHSSRRDLTLHNSGGAGDATLSAGTTAHRSSSSSGKLRSRWSKVARSHSDRTPASRSTATNCSRDNLLAEGCSSISTYCQTEVQSVSVMTQTDDVEVPGWTVIDKERCCLTFDSPNIEHDVENCSHFSSSQKSHCRTSVDSKLHSIRQESLMHKSLTEGKSYTCDKDTCSSAVYAEKHMNEHSCSTDRKPSQQSLPSETDGACNAVEILKPESKVVQESNSTNVQREISRTIVDAYMQDILRKQSYSSEIMSVTENTMDLGSSFASLNSEDMMIDTETDHTMSPSNVRSRHSSVDTIPSTCIRRMSDRLMNCKYTAVPECHQVQNNSNEVILPMGHTVHRKCSAPVDNRCVDSPKHSESTVIDDNSQDAVNGRIGADAVTVFSPTAAISRFIVLLVLFA